LTYFHFGSNLSALSRSIARSSSAVNPQCDRLDRLEPACTLLDLLGQERGFNEMMMKVEASSLGRFVSSAGTRQTGRQRGRG
jgi:hypothetical protein